MKPWKNSDQSIPQNWATLSEGQRVSVKEPGREPYPARIDAMRGTEVVWIISDHGQLRRAFDYREGIVISSA